MALTVLQKNARRDFVDLYGVDQRDVVKLIARGLGSSEISEKLDVSVTSVAATRANVTRGAYVPFLKGNVVTGFVGTCSF